MLMLNENLPGVRLYKRYTEVRGCSHELEKAVIRGLVTLLAHPRNNMIQEAMSVYISGVRWGVGPATSSSDFNLTAQALPKGGLHQSGEIKFKKKAKP